MSAYLPSLPHFRNMRERPRSLKVKPRESGAGEAANHRHGFTARAADFYSVWGVESHFRFIASYSRDCHAWSFRMFFGFVVFG